MFGCGAQTENNNSAEPPSSAIVNGTSVKSETAASLGLVLIEFYRTSEAPGQISLIGFCSGTLLGRHTVLTAAHCFDPHLLPGMTLAKVIFETERLTNSPGLSFDVFKSTSHPLYNSEPGIRQNVNSYQTYLSYDHDIAILAFKGSAPNNYKIAKLASKPGANYAGQTDHVYGFGRSTEYTGEDGEQIIFSSGVLREGSVQIKDNFLKFSDRYFIQKNSKDQMTCQGDSGGPHFLESKKSKILIGVTSATLGRTLANGTKSCLEEAQVTKVNPFYYWIKSEEKKLLVELNQEHQ